MLDSIYHLKSHSWHQHAKDLTIQVRDFFYKRRHYITLLRM